MFAAQRRCIGSQLAVLVVAVSTGSCCSSEIGKASFASAPFTITKPPTPLTFYTVSGEKSASSRIFLKLHECKCSLCKCGSAGMEKCESCLFRVPKEGLGQSPDLTAWDFGLGDASADVSVELFFCGCLQSNLFDGKCECTGPLPTSYSEITLNVDYIEGDSLTECYNGSSLGRTLEYKATDDANAIKLRGYVLQEAPTLILTDSRGDPVPNDSTVEFFYDPLEPRLPNFTAFSLSGSKSEPLTATISSVSLKNNTDDPTDPREPFRLSKETKDTPFVLLLDGSDRALIVVISELPSSPREPSSFSATLQINGKVNETGAALAYRIKLLARPSLTPPPSRESENR